MSYSWLIFNIKYEKSLGNFTQTPLDVSQLLQKSVIYDLQIRLSDDKGEPIDGIRD